MRAWRDKSGAQHLKISGTAAHSLLVPGCFHRCWNSTFGTGACYHPVPKYISFIGFGFWHKPVPIFNDWYRVVLWPGAKDFSGHLGLSVQIKKYQLSLHLVLMLVLVPDETISGTFSLDRWLFSISDGRATSSVAMLRSEETSWPGTKRFLERDSEEDDRRSLVVRERRKNDLMTVKRN